jgi:hypothetical protein
MAVTAQPHLDATRAAVAGGIWSLLLYSACVVLHVGFSYPSGSGVLAFWDSIMPGDGHSTRGILIGFPLAFLYGSLAVWLFAGLYNLAAPDTRAGKERS